MFEELAGIPPQNDRGQGAPPEAPDTPGGRLSTIDEGSEQDSEALLLESWYTELMSEEKMLNTIPIDSLYTVPIYTVPDYSVLVTVASEPVQGHLHMRGHPRQHDHEETYHVPLCSTDLDETYGLDFDQNGHYVELCFTTDMAKTVLTEQQHQLLDDESVTTMRVYVTAATKRAVVVK